MLPPNPSLRHSDTLNSTFGYFIQSVKKVLPPKKFCITKITPTPLPSTLRHAKLKKIVYPKIPPSVSTL